jgi:hypothetical protein
VRRGAGNSRTRGSDTQMLVQQVQDSRVLFGIDFSSKVLTGRDHVRYISGGEPVGVAGSGAGSADEPFVVIGNEF